MSKAFSMHGRDAKCIQRVLVGKHQRKLSLGRPSRRWEDNNKMYLKDRVGV